MFLPEEASGPRRRGSLPGWPPAGPDKSKRTGSVELPPVPNCAFVVSYGIGLINPLNCISGGIIAILYCWGRATRSCPPAPLAAATPAIACVHPCQSEVPVEGWSPDRPFHYTNQAIGFQHRWRSTPKAVSVPERAEQAHTRPSVRCAGSRSSSDWRRMPDSSNHILQIEGWRGSAARRQRARCRRAGSRSGVCGRDPRPCPVGRVVEAEIVQQLVRDRVRTGLQRSGCKKVFPPMATPLLPIQLMP